MKAYIFLDITITDSTRYDEYRKLTVATLVPYEGKFIVRGGKRELLDGDWTTDRIVILEFPGMDKAKAWWNSEEYAPAKAIRESASNARVMLLEGFE